MSESSTAIRVEALEKVYLIHHQKPGGYETLREVAMHVARGVLRRARHPLLPNTEDVEVERFFALRDVDFEIKQGERLGIIGRNGVGKSTLLKILSRITPPSAGRVSIRGRVASLLEVGTGFHPELTGRENIYLNGAILGMGRAEIQRKFDAIVDFAGVEQFLDTPVKRYSSGMYVRLAFAVAAHLEPDILLVDEVLAVGDATFQRKCLGKMDEAADDGRTILFVSHNMTAVNHLCRKGLVLDDGRVSFFGSASEAIACYRDAVERCSVDGDLRRVAHRAGSGALRFVQYSFFSRDAERISYGISGEFLEVHVEFETDRSIKNVNVGMAISTRDGMRLSSLATSLLDKELGALPRRGIIVFSIPRLTLNVGTYTVVLDARSGSSILDRVEDAFALKVEAGDFWRSGRVAARENPVLMDFDISVRPGSGGA